MNPAQYVQPPNLPLAPTPSYYELSNKVVRMNEFIYTLRKTIERIGRELNTVRRMNHHLAGQPPPPEIDYMPPQPQFL